MNSSGTVAMCQSSCKLLSYIMSNLVWASILKFYYATYFTDEEIEDQKLSDYSEIYNKHILNGEGNRGFGKIQNRIEMG